MTQNAKTQKTQMSLFLQNHIKAEMEIFAFCVPTFEQIKIQNCWAPQKDRLNLSFVKYVYIVGEKMAGNGRKTAICQSVLNQNSL